MNDVVIIGGGIVGLATGLQLAKANNSLKITILEKEAAVAKHQTGNNSGVIHSGIYYKPGSNKALNCKEGYDLLLDYCEHKKIPYELCGKVIVATDESEIPRLEKIMERGLANGLEGLKYINANEIKEIEPYCTGVKGIWVPQTGIVDYKLVSQHYARDFQELGGTLLLESRVHKVETLKDGLLVHYNNQTIKTRFLVNCAGLYSDKMAHLFGLGKDVKIIPFRGEYYQLKEDKRHLVKNLIYPVPDPKFPFLGVHFTRRVDGMIEAGPNAVLAFRREGYTKKAIKLSEFFESITWPGFIKVAMKYWKVGLYEMYRSFSKRSFTKALQKLIPDIQKTDLEVGGAGVRAQACHRDGSLIDDFYFAEREDVIHVLNAPSPAATSSLSIGKKVAKMVMEKLS